MVQLPSWSFFIFFFFSFFPLSSFSFLLLFAFLLFFSEEWGHQLFFPSSSFIYEFSYITLLDHFFRRLLILSIHYIITYIHIHDMYISFFFLFSSSPLSPLAGPSPSLIIGILSLHIIVNYHWREKAFLTVNAMDGISSFPLLFSQMLWDWREGEEKGSHQPGQRGTLSLNNNTIIINHWHWSPFTILLMHHWPLFNVIVSCLIGIFLIVIVRHWAVNNNKNTDWEADYHL